LTKLTKIEQNIQAILFAAGEPYEKERLAKLLEIDRQTLEQLVERGMGLSFLPEFIVRDALAAGRLARLHTPDCQMEMHRQLFYHRDKWLTPQMKRFIDLVKEA